MTEVWTCQFTVNLQCGRLLLPLSTRGMATESVWFGHETRHCGGATEFLSPVGPGGLAVLHLAFGSASFCWMRSWISANASSWATRIEEYWTRIYNLNMMFKILRIAETNNLEPTSFCMVWICHSLIFVSHSTTGGMLKDWSWKQSDIPL